MADIFLSHSSVDNDAADQIRSWLERDRKSWSVFLDKHARDGILAGQGWQDRLRRELQSCRLVVAIITKDWLASRWCFTEAVTSTFRGKDFVGVVPGPLPDGALDVAPPIVHERQRQPLDLTTGAGWKELLHALDRSGLDPSQWFAIPEGVRPYPGFVAFEEKDAGVFFGRDQEITRYLDELNLLKAPDRAQALVISGGSGSGKSSLLKAGLIPRLRRQPDWLIVPPFDPSREPVHALCAALRTAAQGIGAEIDLPQKPPQTVDALTELLNDSLRAIEEKANAWLLLPLDQAEVLLAGSQSEGETDASRLLAAVGRLLASRARKLVAVLTIRTEFMPALERTLPPAVRLHDRSLRPLTALSEVIEKPAARFGIELEEGLTGRMVEDTRGTDAVPLLAYTLRELYETYGDDKLLRVAEYEQLGGVEGAIEKKLHEALSDPAPTAQELAAFRRCFVRQLVRVDESAIEGERYLRTAVPRDALPEDAMRLVDRLREARLLVGGDDGTIGIAHDRLIRNWADAPLQTWLADDSGDRKLIDTLKSFLAAHRDGGPLLSEKPLLDAKDFLERDRSLKDDEPELAQFIEASVTAEQARLRRRKWQFRGALAASFLFLVLAGGAYLSYLEAQKQTRVAERRAVEAETSLAWSRLEFPMDYVGINDAQGLWWIATTTPAAKHQSHEYLREDGFLAEVYARRPREVIRALSLAPENDVTQTLVRLLNSQKTLVRGQTLRTLGTLGATDQAATIAERLTDSDVGVRQAAVQVLGTLGATNQTAVIAARLTDGSPDVRRAAVEVLGRLGATDQAAAIAARVTDKDPYVRRAAIEALETLGATDPKAVTPMTVKYLADSGSFVCVAAIMALGRLGATDQGAAIAARLTDKNADVRSAAVGALGTLVATDQATAIAARLSDEDPDVRRTAIVALGDIGATDQAAAIAKFLSDEELFLRLVATSVLGRLGATGQAAAIAANITDEAFDVRQAAILAVAKIGATGHAAAIAERLVDDSPDVRQAAVEALGTLGATDQAAAIAKLLANDAHDDASDVRRAAIEALARLGATDPNAITPMIIEHLADKDPYVRRVSIAALGRLGATDQVTAIAELLTDSNFNVRQAAVEALGTLGATDQAAAIAASLTDGDPLVNQAAAKALETLAALEGTDDLASHLAATTRHQLLASPSSANAVAAAIVGISSTMDPAQAAAEIVETLKHPVLGGEEATRTLLAGLKARFPEAPGPDRGLYPNLAWIETKFPDIDLRSPPRDDQAAQLSLVRKG